MQESNFEWKLPQAITKSSLVNHELEKYYYTNCMIIPERLTQIRENGDIYFMGELIGNKNDHPYFDFGNLY